MAMPDVHWGYGFPIGGVAAVDADDGRDHAGRHRVRHQLRRAPARARGSRWRRSRPSATGSPIACSRRFPPGWDRRARCRRSRRATSGACSSAARHGRSRRASDARPTSSTARMAGRLARRRSGRRLRDGADAWPVAGRHARLRQSLPRGPAGGSDRRRAGRGRARHRGGTGRRHDPLGLARPRVPGVRRRPARDGPRHAAPRHLGARSPARLRAAAFGGGRDVPRGDGRGRELRVGESPGDDGSGGARLPRGARHRSGGARLRPGVRRVPQHREDGGARRRRTRPPRLRPSQGRDASLRPGPSGAAASRCAISASR